jgi:hypothetical protein
MIDAAVLITSYDGYADLWPFAAELFERFWSDRPWPMYWMTNTEIVPWIATPIYQEPVMREHWGLNIADAVDSISEEFVVMWPEEELLLTKVPTDLCIEAVKHLRENPDVGCVNLIRYYLQCDKPTIGRFTDYPETPWTNRRFAPLPALWRKEVLTTLLRGVPNSRDFEMEGSDWMTRHYPNVRCLTPCVETFNICDNALLKGPWRKCAVGHLLQLGFNPDFTKRGISQDECAWMDGKGL